MTNSLIQINVLNIQILSSCQWCQFKHLLSLSFFLSNLQTGAKVFILEIERSSNDTIFQIVWSQLRMPFKKLSNNHDGTNMADMSENVSL